MNDFSSLGENLRKIREQQNLNLSDVSELTGISKAMLSKIERGESVPTITTVWKIANGLKITLNDLAKEDNVEYVVRNIENITPLVEDDEKFSLYPMFPFSPLDGVQIFYAIIKPGYHVEEPMFIHASSEKEYCIVFQGRLDIEIEDRTHALNEGTGIDFDPHQKHGYINPGNEDAIACMLLI